MGAVAFAAGLIALIATGGESAIAALVAFLGLFTFAFSAPSRWLGIGRGGGGDGGPAIGGDWDPGDGGHHGHHGGDAGGWGGDGGGGGGDGGGGGG